jgi:hypothetical protein
MSKTPANTTGRSANGFWRKSSYSNPSGNCVELAETPTGLIAMRNSREPESGVLLYTRAEVDAFIRGAKDGEFDDLTI